MPSGTKRSTLLLLAGLALTLLGAQAQANPKPTVVADTTQPPFSAVGRLFVTHGNRHGSGVCTATAISDPSRSLVLTAAHCLSDFVCEGCPLKVARSARFVPAYDRGRAPYGSFAVEAWKVPRAWRGVNTNYDTAVLSVATNNRGEYLTDAVGGGLEVAMDRPRDQTYRLVGYPGGQQRPMRTCSARFDGNDPLSYPLAGPPAFRVNCFMGDGASGGPFLIDGGTRVNGLVSYDKKGEQRRLRTYSPYFSSRTVGALIAGF